MKTIYDLELHEKITIETSDAGSLTVRRVQGGWIYINTVNDKNKIFSVSQVFVPDPKLGK